MVTIILCAAVMYDMHYSHKQIRLKPGFSCYAVNRALSDRRNCSGLDAAVADGPVNRVSDRRQQRNVYGNNEVKSSQVRIAFNITSISRTSVTKKKDKNN